MPNFTKYFEVCQFFINYIYNANEISNINKMLFSATLKLTLR